jgi:hypothetical protein
MAKSTLFRHALLILFLGAANMPAQEQGIIPPPLPSVIPPEPPDPDTLPPPPQLEWESLVPKGAEEEGGAVVVTAIPPPQAEAEIPPPPPPIVETPLPGGPDPGEVELATPDVEIWRQEGDMPQIPARHSNRLDVAYMTGTEPVWLRVQFDPQAAGKSVLVRPGLGITVNPPRTILTVASNGECLVLAQLVNGANRSHLIFYCDGVRTVLPIMRAALPTVVAKEQETGGGQ